MTDHEINAEFVRIEKLANKTPQGVDHEAVLRTQAAKADRPLDEVRRIILDGCFMGPC